MPLPMPTEKESKDKFIDRAMSDPAMNEEFPDATQRRAVAESQWEKHLKSKRSEFIF